MEEGRERKPQTSLGVMKSSSEGRERQSTWLTPRVLIRTRPMRNCRGLDGPQESSPVRLAPRHSTRRLRDASVVRRSSPTGGRSRTPSGIERPVQPRSRIAQGEQDEHLSIDRLVEGLDGRLAVECDGDVWHGADRYDEDMARQRVLERCGLRFWRVRGSTYYRNGEAALRQSWQTLEPLRVTPTSA